MYVQIENWVSDHSFTHSRTHPTHQFTGRIMEYGITVSLYHVWNNYIKNVHNIVGKNLLTQY